ncbi:MAG: DUF4178 domain-containing protein [Spirochaetota bacterium]|nr:DUF4178 domain-containing protein [Spirochaetota bacterium]
MLGDFINSMKKLWGGSSDGSFNIKVSQKALKNLAPGRTIIFKNLPEIIYNSLIGKTLDIDKLQFEVKLEIQYNEEGFAYKEFKLEEEGMEFWLEVIRDMGTWTLSLWKRMPELKQNLYLKSGKVVKSLVYENQTYKLDETGIANFNMLDEENPQKGTIKYWRFQCEEDPKKVFAVTDWMESEQYECAVGEWIREKDFEILVFSASFQ